jgi:hypothetical protein
MNYIEFGIIKKKTKKSYQVLKGKLYDDFMLLRYFRDIYHIENSKKNNLKKLFYLYKNLNDPKDIRFNLINTILLKLSSNNFYEFGFTLYEKIYYFKFFFKFLNYYINIKTIKFYGNDISKQFIFFCKKFYSSEKYQLRLDMKFKKEKVKNAVFFSKGVSLLYSKNNLDILRTAIQQSSCGSFDFSINLRGKFIRQLETGYNLYYPSIEDFIKTINISNKNKYFLIRNIKKKNDLVYFEMVYGNKHIISEFDKEFNCISKKYKKRTKEILGLDKKFDFFNGNLIFKKNKPLHE